MSYKRHVISSVGINRITTRSRWKFRICTTTNDLTLYCFSSLYIFVTWGWPTVAEKCHQPNKTDTKTAVFWCTYPLLMKNYFRPLVCFVYALSLWSESLITQESITGLTAESIWLNPKIMVPVIHYWKLLFIRKEICHQWGRPFERKV